MLKIKFAFGIQLCWRWLMFELSIICRGRGNLFMLHSLWRFKQRPVWQNELNKSWISFCYQAPLNLTQAIQLHRQMRLVIGSVNHSQFPNQDVSTFTYKGQCLQQITNRKHGQLEAAHHDPVLMLYFDGLRDLQPDFRLSRSTVLASAALNQVFPEHLAYHAPQWMLSPTEFLTKLSGSSLFQFLFM